ncbi:GNAT family N-acetyltransferase [Aquitalea magnusonii]|uniref:RimJ/RimL family protein N-acetyltransferase n=1 Tax=Aquitalea magnusonii TaxID=332411 RepID=A0A318J3S6_9NEIS|nr:GNAT family N-acetyltransferase [Aquitalea magnusonii]PXX41330.1 RimJ/RimL family protein N-acetyltransferase [Aquitalea magnusonii]
MLPILTSRLRLREFNLQDAPLVLALLTDPDFIRNVTDRGVHTLEDAGNYISRGPLASYAQHGIGLWCMERLEDGQPVGMCGLIRREGLADVDVGYTLLPAWRGLGYASEAATACVQYGLQQLRLPRVVAYTNADNQASARVLQKAGLHGCGPFDFPGSSAPTLLFSSDAAMAQS